MSTSSGCAYDRSSAEKDVPAAMRSEQYDLAFVDGLHETEQCLDLFRATCGVYDDVGLVQYCGSGVSRANSVL